MGRKIHRPHVRSLTEAPWPVMSDPRTFVRKATEADRDIIAGDLSAGVYDGNDYLPARMDFYFADQEAGLKHMLLCCDADTGVPCGLDVVCLYDGGETVMLQALRVREDARGKGVATALSEAARDLVHTGLTPRPSLMRIITTRTNPSVGLHTKQGYMQTHEFGICGTAIVESEAAPIATLGDVDSLVEVSNAADVIRRISSQPEPPPYVLFDWQVERWSIQNLERLQRCHSVRFFAHAEGDQVGGAALSLSLGALTDWVNGRQMYASIFAGGNREVFAEHARHWVRTAIRCKASHMVIFYDATLHPQRVGHTALSLELGHHKGDWIPFFESSGGVIVMEKAIDGRSSEKPLVVV